MVLLRLARWWMGLALGCAPAGLAASEAAFSAALAAEERTAAGLTRLTPEQVEALDRQVAREVSFARQGDVIAFAGTFSTRRPASEHAAAGLDRLTAAEREVLDGLVARALAHRPPVWLPRAQAAASTVETITRRPQWHGQVTMTYGRGSGGSELYGGSLTTVYDDPDRGFSAALSLGQYRGTGGAFLDPYQRYGYDGYGRHPYAYGAGPEAVYRRAR